MKSDDLYTHFKGTEYKFVGIAIPMDDSNLAKGLLDNLKNPFPVRYHEDSHDLAIYTSQGLIFIDSNVPHVIYQSEKDYGTGKFYAREVDDFFGYKEKPDGSLIKRFTLKK